jgi:hypothetical protein
MENASDCDGGCVSRGGGGVGGDDGGGSYRDARGDEALWSGYGFASADGAGVGASQYSCPPMQHPRHAIWCVQPCWDPARSSSIPKYRLA